MDRIVRSNRRYRYISFHLTCQGPTQSYRNSDLLQALRQNARNAYSANAKNFNFWVVQFDGTSGIIKCPYKDKAQMIQLLQSLQMIGGTPVRITTQSTSGTIRGIIKKK